MRIWSLFLLCMLLFGGTAAQAASPLLQEGKKTLYQRVVSHPGAALYAAATGNDVVKSPVRTFSVFYVYAREGARLQVGAGTTGGEG